MRKMSDKVQDAKAMKGMKPAQKAMFKAKDAAMDKKKPSPAKDKVMDAALAKKIRGMKK